MNSQDVALQALRQQIQEKSAEDPHIAAKIASKALLDQVLLLA